MTPNPRPIPADNLDFDAHSFRTTGGTVTQETAPTIPTDVTTNPRTMDHPWAEWLGRRIGESIIYGLLALGLWTAMKWFATAIVAMDAHEDCVRLTRQADYGFIAQEVVPKYCEALLHP